VSLEQFRKKNQNFITPAWFAVRTSFGLSILKKSISRNIYHHTLIRSRILLEKQSCKESKSFLLRANGFQFKVESEIFQFCRTFTICQSNVFQHTSSDIKNFWASANGMVTRERERAWVWKRKRARYKERKREGRRKKERVTEIKRDRDDDEANVHVQAFMFWHQMHQSTNRILWIVTDSIGRKAFSEARSGL